MQHFGNNFEFVHFFIVLDEGTVSPMKNIVRRYVREGEGGYLRLPNPLIHQVQVYIQ